MLCSFSTIFDKGDNFYDFLFTFCILSVHQYPSEKGATLKRKNLLPKGSKFFPFREDPFPEGSKINFHRIVSLENVSIHTLSEGQ